MGIFNDFQRMALAFLGISVAALYGAAYLSPQEPQRQEAAHEWIALPKVAPKSVQSAAIAVTVAPTLIPVLRAPESGARDAVKAPVVTGPQDKLSGAPFDLEAIRQGDQPVPRHFVRVLPKHLNALDDAEKLKTNFIATVLPLALKVNEEILAARHELVLLQKQTHRGRPLSVEQRAWLAALAADYDVSPDNFLELLKRVDVISPALAVAQSAEESGWGRSRFALKGNALFGQRTWDKGLGIVPKERDEEGRHEVRVFPTLLDSVRSYARNLNGHPAYDEFRVRRANMRARGKALDPYGLVETLTAYSERREHYVQTIRKILRIDSLEELEGTRLEVRPVKTTQAQTPDLPQ